MDVWSTAIGQRVRKMNADGTPADTPVTATAEEVAELRFVLLGRVGDKDTPSTRIWCLMFCGRRIVDKEGKRYRL